MLTLMLMILLTGCSCKYACPHFPKMSDAVKEELRPLQDKDEHPDTWAYFNELYKLCKKLGDCD